MKKEAQTKKANQPPVSFKKRVLAVVRKIPAVQTLSYGEVACRAGNSRASRAVGSILRTNFDPGIPCHRVIRGDGSLGGYNRGRRAKLAILNKGGYIRKVTETQKELVKELVEERRVLKNARLREAFIAFDRADFVDENYKCEAYEDYPLPIGFNQTISQPTTVAFMLELLDIQSGEKVLDVGSGSGWTTALLSHLVGKNGYVSAIELVPELVEKGRENIGKYHIKNAEIRPAREELGFAKGGPYDRILVSAAADDTIPEDLLIQLKPGGVMVLPVGGTLVKVIKKGEGDFETKQFPGFVFVPLR